MANKLANIITSYGKSAIKIKEPILKFIKEGLKPGPKSIIVRTHIPEIVDMMIQHLISTNKNNEKIKLLISKLIQESNNLTEIIDGAVQAYIEKNSIDKISGLISELAASKCINTYMYDIVNAAVLAPLLLGETIQEAVIIFHRCKVGLESSKQIDKIKPIFL